MEQYIKKSTLVAEIEKLIDEIYAGRPFDSLSSEQQTALWYIKSIMSSVNTLEVKEVDLEKEIQDSIYNRFFDLEGIAIAGSSLYATVEDMVYVAKHFFELGLKAQKGEDV